ncbi:MAG: hypothetical protein ACYSOQ_06220 [Planctomycetota bacterium]
MEKGTQSVKGEEVWTKVVMDPEVPGIQFKLIRKETNSKTSSR